MKNTLLITLLLVFAIGRAQNNIPVSSLPVADTTGSPDFYPVVQHGHYKRVDVGVISTQLDSFINSKVLSGPTGPTGIKGAQGSTGATGQDGAAGPSGNDGANGATGATGVTGATGSGGFWGATGNTGLTPANLIGSTDGSTFVIANTVDSVYIEMGVLGGKKDMFLAAPNILASTMAAVTYFKCKDSDSSTTITKFKTQYGTHNIGDVLVCSNTDGTGQWTTLPGSIVSYVYDSAATTNTGFFYSPLANGTFTISGYVNVTAISGATISQVITYTDNYSNAQTITTISGVTATGFVHPVPQTFRAKQGTNIFVSTSITGGTATYDFSATFSYNGN